jgi:hypothetical protein
MEFYNVYLTAIVIIFIIEALFIVINQVFNWLMRLPEDKLLQGIKYANGYEIAYLHGGEDEAVQLGVVNLITHGFLDYQGGHFTVDKHKKLLLDELHPIEKELYEYLDHHPERIWLFRNYKGYSLNMYLPETEKQFRLYDRKFDNLRLLNPFHSLKQYNQKFLLLLFISGLFVNYALEYTTFLSGVLITLRYGALSFVFYVLIMLIISYLVNRLSFNGERYIRLFEKYRYPLPDIKKQYNDYQVVIMRGSESCQGI